MSSVIEVKHLTKEYRLGALTSLKDSVRHGLARLTGKMDLAWERQRFKALEDVNFSIKAGEVVGIIGHNGAGKSTLLKHLAYITRPTSGQVHVRGSVAPLIEVGAGLNPELTGRENIYLNGAILGIPKKEIDRKVDEIIEFSELEQFIDTPVKRYSSGMTVKLGFSIATSIDADILIVDEVLAVGDLAFQRKCFDRMEGMIGGQEKTVLLVSHNIRQITRMCDRVILLDHGAITADGKPEEVCNRFYEENNARILENLKATRTAVHEKHDIVELRSISVLSPEGKEIDVVESGQDLRIRVTLKVNKEIARPELVIGTHTTDFVYLTASTTDLGDLDIESLRPGEYSIDLIQYGYPMKPGHYGIRMAVFGKNRNSIYSEENLYFFSVKPKEKDVRQPPLRLLNVDSTWKLDKIL